MARRRFLNLVVKSNLTGLHSLRRIPANRLFYPSTRAAEAATTKSQESFNSYMEEHHKHPGLKFMDRLFRQSILEFAALLGDDEDKILVADNNGNTTVLDAGSSSFTLSPSLNCNKGRGAIAVSMTNSDPDEPDRLYPPPAATYTLVDAVAATVVNDLTIYVSSTMPERGGTHAFDTITHNWRRVGYWKMPFGGRVEY
uniref:Uncharacterized protein n=1 Tax=Leersia perrieri TaxID=77586 RepID=A0A0D9XN97_9ORYZ